ncbi:MAG: hypothetical protein L7U72_06345 [Rubripirellula sp.]|nr:hypothetical protein [Rubripirellula sp.]
MCIDDFKIALAECADGRVESLQAVYDSWHEVVGVVRFWIDCVGDSALEGGASWLLKHWVEAGSEIESTDQHELLNRLDAVTSWQARLHLLQILEHLLIPEEFREVVASFCNESILSSNTFVRAWGYSGMVTLAKQWPCYISRALDAIELGESEDAASVRARVRRIRQTIPDDWGINEV